MLYDLKEVSPHKYSLIKRAEGAASGVGESNTRIAEDILVFINKLSEKFKDTFDTVTDPTAYKKIYDSVQQMEPADLARVGALLGGGAVGFRRALAGDSVASVMRGVATGAVLGAASGYFLPQVLDTLVGAKQASFGQNPGAGAGHAKVATPALLQKYSLSKRAEGDVVGSFGSPPGLAEDILSVITTIPEKIQESFDAVTDPDVYKSLYDAVQQEHPRNLARIGFLLGSAAVAFPRALKGRSAFDVCLGSVIGGLLGHAGASFLPNVLATLAGEKQASFGKNPDTGSWHAKVATPALLQKYSLSKRAEGDVAGSFGSSPGLAEDLLSIVTTIPGKFQESFGILAEPDIYKKIYDSVKQGDPVPLEPFGIVIGSGVVSLRRLLRGDSKKDIINGATVGGLLGAISAGLLPYALVALIGEKKASFGQNPDAGAGHVKTSAIVVPLMALLAAGAGIMGAYIYGQSVGAKASAERYEAQLQVSKQRLQEALKATKWSNPSNLFKLDRADAISTLAGGGVGSLLGYLYARHKNRGKDEDDEERVNPVVSSLIGGGVGSIVGLLARRAIAPPAATSKAG